MVLAQDPTHSSRFQGQGYYSQFDRGSGCDWIGPAASAPALAMTCSTSGSWKLEAGSWFVTEVFCDRQVSLDQVRDRVCHLRMFVVVRYVSVCADSAGGSVSRCLSAIGG